VDYLTTLKEHLRLFWRLSSGTKTQYANSLTCYLELFLGLGSYENLRENQVGWISTRNPTVLRAEGDGNYDFFWEERMADKARNALYKVWLLSFEPNPNPAPTRTLSASRPRSGPWNGSGRGPRAGPGTVQASVWWLHSPSLSPRPYTLPAFRVQEDGELKTSESLLAVTAIWLLIWNKNVTCGNKEHSALYWAIELLHIQNNFPVRLKQ
jgi:hypothetical protein